MVKVGIIGLGKMGISHLSILNANPNVEIVGLADESKFIIKSFKKLARFNVFFDYKKMIKQTEPDAVVISTPSSLHFEIAKYAVENGINVFIEKPLTLSYSESEELVRLSQNKVITQVGYHNRFISTFNFAKKIVENECLGQIYNFWAQAHGPAITKPSNSWRTNSPVGGGCLYDYGSHVINLLSFILGVPDFVKFAYFNSIHSKNVEDFVSAQMGYKKNNLHAYLELNWSDESYRRMQTELTIWGTKGKLYVNSQEAHIFLKDDCALENLKKGWNIKYLIDFKNDIKFFVRGEEYSAQLEYFIEKIIKKDYENINSFYEASLTDFVIEKINRYRGNNG